MTSRPYELCFLIAPPRSGTTWLSTALNAHPSIFCTESRLFGHFFDVVHDGAEADPRVRITMQSYAESLATCFNTESLAGSARDDLLGAMAWSLFDLAYERTQCALVVEKITPYVGTSADVIAGIRTHFPKSRIIRLMRDPRDVLVSGVMHWLGRWSGDAAGAHAAQRTRWLLNGDASAAMDRLCTDAEVTDWTSAWLEPIAITNALAQSHPMHRVTFESMLDDQRSVLRGLFEFLSLPADDETLASCQDDSSFERMSGGRQRGSAARAGHVRLGVAGDWRNWLTQADARLLTRLAAGNLKHVGYVVDDSWVAALPERLNRPRVGAN